MNWRGTKIKSRYFQRGKLEFFRVSKRRDLRYVMVFLRLHLEMRMQYGVNPAKGVIVKGLSSKEFVVCNDLVLALPNRITAISDGAAATPKQSGGWGGSGYKVAFVPKAFPLHANHLSASMLYNSFIIDKATSDLKNTNVRLKDMINQAVCRIVLLSFDIARLN
ncbi:hypothetical protein KY284_003978 [Solanum tuberosum]|nr:hypothetical protein KY284_003978 [Solanum tuberosum]